MVTSATGHKKKSRYLVTSSQLGRSLCKIKTNWDKIRKRQLKSMKLYIFINSWEYCGGNINYPNFKSKYILSIAGH